MAAANLTQIFNLLVEHKEISVTTPDSNEHERLRVNLAKLWKRHKDNLKDIGYDDGSLSLSLCAKRESNTGTSKFSLAERSKGNQTKTFEIVTSTIH